MSFYNLLRIAKSIVVGVVIVYGLIYLCPLGPCCPRFRTNLSKPCPEFVGPLTRNNYLDASQRIFENEIGFGPESIAVRNGEFYTGTSSGSIFKFKDNKLEEVFKIGPANCIPASTANDDDLKCGFPLGLRFDSRGDLLVADAVKGIFKINLNTKKNVTLVPITTRVDGVKINFPDDLDVTKSGDIYFSDSTSSWSLDNPQWLNFLNTRPNGRILHYNPNNKQVKTVLDHLYLPTGVQLSPEEDFLLIAQGFAPNILKYHLKGPKQGQAEILISNLPGTLDNIRPSGRGTYWVSLFKTRVPWELSLWEKLDVCLFIKFAVYGSVEIISKVLSFVQQFMQMPFISSALYWCDHQLSETIFHSNGIIVEFTSNGEILRSLHSPKGIISGVTQVTEQEGTLYLSTAFYSYIGKLKLKNT